MPSSAVLNIILGDFIATGCTRTPNRVNVFGTGMTLPGHADVSQAAAGPCRLQLDAVLGSSDIKLSEFYCNIHRPIACLLHFQKTAYRAGIKVYHVFSLSLLNEKAQIKYP
jgi:hypothetical protein